MQSVLGLVCRIIIRSRYMLHSKAPAATAHNYSMFVEGSHTDIELWANAHVTSD